MVEGEGPTCSPETSNKTKVIAITLCPPIWWQALTIGMCPVSLLCQITGISASLPTPMLTGSCLLCITLRLLTGQITGRTSRLSLSLSYRRIYIQAVPGARSWVVCWSCETCHSHILSPNLSCQVYQPSKACSLVYSGNPLASYLMEPKARLTGPHTKQFLLAITSLFMKLKKQGFRGGTSVAAM